MPLPQNHYVAQAEGDGNCAFNSWILGLCDLIVQGKLDAKEETQGRILQLWNERFDSEFDWQELKDHLNTIKKAKDFITLQNNLADAFRQLCFDRIKDEEAEAAEYFDKTEQLLAAAYDNGDDDDILMRHQFIINKINELKKTKIKSPKKLVLLTKQQIKDKKINLLKTWWLEDGYSQFLANMREDKQWAGDIELAQLSRYFSVNVNIYRNGAVLTNIYEAGQLPVDALPEAIIVAISGVLIEGGGKDNNKRLHFKWLSEVEVQQELDILFLLGKLTKDYYQKILLLWREHHLEQPVVQLVNNTGTHWNCVTSSDWLKPLKVDAYKSAKPRHELTEKKVLRHENKDDSFQAKRITCFEVDGDDSSDEEEADKYEQLPKIIEQKERYLQHQPKFLQTTDPNGYSFVAHAIGTKILYSPLVNAKYYAFKEKLAANKIYINDKEVTDDKSLLPWVNASLKQSLKIAFSKMGNESLSKKLFDGFIKDNEEVTKLTSTQLTKQKRYLFKQINNSLVMLVAFKEIFKPLINAVKDFLIESTNDKSLFPSPTFKIDELSNDGKIKIALLANIRKYLVDNDLIKNGKLILQGTGTSSRKSKIDKLIAKEKSWAYKKVLSACRDMYSRSIDAILQENAKSFCRYIVIEQIFGSEKAEKNEGIMEYNFKVKSNKKAKEYLPLLYAANPQAVNACFPPDALILMEQSQAQFDILFFQAWPQILKENKSTYNIRLERGVLEEQYKFSSSSTIEYLAYLRLAYRDQLRQIRQAEDDQGIITGNKFQRAWRFGKLNHLALENETVTVHGAKVDLVINLGSYEKIAGLIKEWTNKINSELEDKKQDPINNNRFAVWIKKIIRHEGEIIFDNSEGDALELSRATQKRFTSFLVDLTYLILGCEVLRNPASLVTQMLILDQIAAGKLAWDTALNKKERQREGLPLRRIQGGGGDMPMSMGKYLGDSDKKEKAEPVAAARTLQDHYGLFTVKRYRYPGSSSDPAHSSKDAYHTQELTRRQRDLISPLLQGKGKVEEKEIEKLEQTAREWFKIGC